MKDDSKNKTKCETCGVTLAGQVFSLIDKKKKRFDYCSAVCRAVGRSKRK